MSAGLTAAGGLYGGVAQYEAGQERGSLYRANAGIATAQYQSELAATSQNESNIRRKGEALESRTSRRLGGCS